MWTAPTESQAGAFRVICRKHDGREVIFATYAKATEAQLVADRLCAIGCAARIVVIEAQP